MALARNHALYFAWLIALIGFCISVFYGEILGHPPCPLCWYQRIALFPLVILLGIAAYRKEAVIVPYVFPLVIIGDLIAIFHLLLPHFLFLQKASVCQIGVSCSQSVMSFFGMNGLSLLSALGFTLIAVLLYPLLYKVPHD